ncbi:IS3 family transposase [Empedobacter falsenii]
MQLKMQIKQPIHYCNNIRMKLNLNKMSSIEYRTHFYNN